MRSLEEAYSRLIRDKLSFSRGELASSSPLPLSSFVRLLCPHVASQMDTDRQTNQHFLRFNNNPTIDHRFWTLYSIVWKKKFNLDQSKLNVKKFQDLNIKGRLLPKLPDREWCIPEMHKIQ